MTSGEKINYYRKQLGLSQEELGQKLLVSRQTISLWEKGQTVPTIDNLIRLKEIFGVSVDEILGCEEEKADENTSEEVVPNEKYKFKFSKKDIDFIYGHTNNKPLIRFIVFLLIVVIGIALIISNNDELTNGHIFSLGILCSWLVISLWAFGINLKNAKTIKQRVVDSSYEYNVYEDYFSVIIEGKKSTSNYNFRFDEIKRFLDIGEFLLLFIDNQYYMLRKQELVSKSMFTWLAKGNPEKTIINKKGRTAAKFILNFFFVATLFSLFIPLIIMSYVVPVEPMVFNDSWLFFTALPITLTSLVLGVIFKRKGYKCKKNIVAGIIFTILLCIYGSIGFTAQDPYDHSDTAIIRAEETIGIEIPEHKQINTTEWLCETTTPAKGYLYYTSYIIFDEDKVVDFEKEISESPIWLSEVPNNIVGIMSPQVEALQGDYRLVYNTKTKDFNTLPQENGLYRFFYICYDSESNSMRIDEYNIEYIK